MIIMEVRAFIFIFYWFNLSEFIDGYDFTFVDVEGSPGMPGRGAGRGRAGSGGMLNKRDTLFILFILFNGGDAIYRWLQSS